MNALTQNIGKIHTTELGIERIKRNLDLETDDILNWCKPRIEQAIRITKKGKNWYVCAYDSIITINANSYTVITARKYNPLEDTQNMTYEELRRLGIPRDWCSILVTHLNKITFLIGKSMITRGMSVDNVFEAIHLSEEERRLKNDHYWERIIAALYDKSFEIHECFRAIIDERICEIATNLMKKHVSIKDISEATGLAKKQIEKLKNKSKNG